MVIGSLISRRLIQLVLLIALAFILLASRSMADDQIVKTDATVDSGQIMSASDGQVMIQTRSANGGIAKFPVLISDIKSILMAVPAAVTAAEAPGVSPADVITALEPQVKQFSGLPADWVVDAMAHLADAYVADGHPDLALAVYNQILQLYPGRNYIYVGQAGKAEMSLKAGKIDEALAAVQPIVDQANKNIAPSPSDGALYARAFLVYGQALEAQKKPQQALEAYLTVKTMLYQDAALADQADQLAKNLRDQNPGLGIE
jgi:tetratricopeptide (TPR) repeat protein